MSEENKKEERKKFEINVDPEKFDSIGQFILTTSSDFGKLVHQCFSVFDDYFNLKYEPAKTIQVNGKPVFIEPSFTLAFRHGEFPEGSLLGVEPALKEQTNSANAVLRIRGLDNIRELGGKYQATDDLKDVIEKYLIPNYFNNGKILWNQVCKEFQDRGWNIYNQNSSTPYTLICGISLRRLAYLIYGREVDGDKFDYTVIEQGPAAVNPQGVPTNYIIQINKVSVNNVNKLCNYYGYNPTANGWIVNS